MSSAEGIKTTKESERIEELRRILESEQKRPVTYEEAFEVARLLTSFYDKLADNALGIGHVAAAKERL